MIRRPKHDDLSRAIQAALEAEYQRGWSDATAALVAAASSKRSKGSKQGSTPPPRAAPKKQARPSLKDVNKRVTAREFVTKTLEVNPGLQAGEIFELAKAKGTAVTFDAVRQAIKRLTQSGYLVRLGAGYAVKATPRTK